MTELIERPPLEQQVHVVPSIPDQVKVKTYTADTLPCMIPGITRIEQGLVASVSG